MIDHQVRDIVVESLRKVVRLRPELAPRLTDPDLDLPISDLDIDSLDAIEWCMEIETKMGIELEPADLAVARSIADLVALVAERSQGGPVAITFKPAPRDQPLPLSFVQQQTWDYCQNSRVAGGYVLCMKEQIDGPLNVELLRDCLDEMVRRHEVFRTTFPAFKGRPAALIHPAQPVALPVFDLRGDKNPAKAAESIIEAERARIGALARGPLARFALVRLGDDTYWLLRACHHILWDSWSSVLFLDELAALYEEKHRKVAVPPSTQQALQYADYAAWQRQAFSPNGPEHQKAIAWWRDRFRDQPPVRELPFRRPKPLAGIDPSAGTISWPVDSRLSDALTELRRREGATYYQIWLSAFVAQLALASACPDVVIGIYVTNRRRPETRNMLGDFANTLALNFRFDPERTFVEWVSTVRNTLNAAEAWSELPHERLRAELRAADVKVPDINAIFSMIPEHARAHSRRFCGLSVTPQANTRSAEMPWGFSFSVWETQGQQIFATTFDAGLHDPAGVRTFVDQLLKLLGAALHRPDVPLGTLAAECADARKLVIKA
jgi:acyl carrier protein